MHSRLPPSPQPLRVLPPKGRGTGWLIQHRFASQRHEPFDDGWGSLEQEVQDDDGPHVAGPAPGPAPGPATQVIEQRVKSVLSGNDSPDIPFDIALNPYRGCEHGCIYCYARPTHSYLNLSPGLDFETRIFAKVNAAERLRAALMAPGYEPLRLNLGAATDAYQPAERRLGITRSVIQVLSEFHHPFSVITKSAGIERDLDLLAPMAAKGLVAAYVSITTLDPALARLLEPRAASPQRRLQAVRRLADAGVPVGVSVSPVIPFLNEPEIERILRASAEAGASRAFCTVLRLPWEVNPLFQQWLQAFFPDRAARVMARLREMRGGRDYDADFSQRMTGHGIWAQLVRQRFDKGCDRYGLGRERIDLDLQQFRRPAASGVSAPATPAAAGLPVARPVQGSLF